MLAGYTYIARQQKWYLLMIVVSKSMELLVTAFDSILWPVIYV